MMLRLLWLTVMLSALLQCDFGIDEDEYFIKDGKTYYISFTFLDQIISVIDYIDLEVFGSSEVTITPFEWTANASYIKFSISAQSQEIRPRKDFLYLKSVNSSVRLVSLFIDFKALGYGWRQFNGFLESLRGTKNNGAIRSAFFLHCG